MAEPGDAYALTVRNLQRFPSAILNGVDGDGYPCGVRCQPEPRGDGTLSVHAPPGIGLQPGPASLLCHSMNEKLWNLQSFLVRGTLEKDEQGLRFRPEQFVPGAGMTNALKSLLAMRKRAGAYLRRSGESRPKVPWALIKEAKKRGSAKPRSES